MGRALVALAALVAGLVTGLLSVVMVAEAATMCDFYRMIQYDLRGAPMGSRRAALNHHAVSGLAVLSADLSRAVVIVPALKVDVSSLTEFVQNKGLLGALLLLLPRRSNGSGGDGEDPDESVTKGLMELEQWLVRNTFQFILHTRTTICRMYLRRLLRMMQRAGLPQLLLEGMVARIAS